MSGTENMPNMPKRGVPTLILACYIQVHTCLPQHNDMLDF